MRDWIFGIFGGVIMFGCPVIIALMGN